MKYFSIVGIQGMYRGVLGVEIRGVVGQIIKGFESYVKEFGFGFIGKKELLKGVKEGVRYVGFAICLEILLLKQCGGGIKELELLVGRLVKELLQKFRRKDEDRFELVQWKQWR